MNVLCRYLTICSAALYIWVSGALFWHGHSHDDIHTHHCDHRQHTDSSPHQHDAETCSICFFIHTGGITLPNSIDYPSISEKYISLILGSSIVVRYAEGFLQQSSNKDPPFLSE